MKHKHSWIRRAAACLLGLAMTSSLLPPVLVPVSVTASDSLFDEWDYENLSSRYTRQAEYLDRGVVAVRTDDMDYVFISWRLNGYEPEGSMFNIYRDGIQITSAPVYTTNYQDKDGGLNSMYSVGLVIDGQEVERSEPVSVFENQYLEIPLAAPPKITTLDIVTDASSETLDRPAVFTPNDVHTADLDGDGRYDFVVKLVPSNQNDPMGNLADKTYLDGYTMDGEHLWRIDLGPNLRSQRHGIQPLVYDFDGDGRAEISVITADGTVSLRPKTGASGTYGTFGNFHLQSDIYETLDDNYDVVSVIGDPREVGKSVQHGKWVQDSSQDYMNQEGPLFLTVFDGLTGEEIHTIPYDPQSSRTGYDIAVNGYPEGPITVDGFTFSGYPLPEGAMPINTAATNGVRSWGNYTNHSWRMNSVVAYLDGETPGMIFQRGIYMGRVALSAYNLVKTSDGKRRLVQEWRADTYDSSAEGGQPRFGGIDSQGNHNVSVGDLDGSGKDSIIIGSSAVKYDGTLLWTTSRGHGDAQHLGKYDPTRPGLQFMSVHERSTYGFSFLDASTGWDIAKRQSGTEDTGRGIVGIWGDFNGAHAVLSASNGMGGFRYEGGQGTANALTKLEDGKDLPSTAESTNTANFRIYWDGDLWDEAMDGYDPAGTKDRDMEYGIYKYNEDTEYMELIFETEGCSTIDFTKKPPCAVADIFGDWREEFIARTADNSAIRIYTTVIPTEYRYYTFMHDALYRVSAARQYSGYNQPPHIGFYLADRDGQRDLQPQANIFTANGKDIFIDKNPTAETTAVFGDVDIQLQVEAASNPDSANLQYQWYQTTGAANQFSRRPVPGTPIQGATNAVYKLPENIPVGEYYYYCVVSDADGVLRDKTSFVSKVKIMASVEIEITSQPPRALTTVVDKINSRLSINAKATPENAVTYQWYQSASADGTGGTAIPGATDSTFEIPKNLKVGTYYFYCIVSAEGAQNVQSRSTEVLVNYDIYQWFDGNSFTDSSNIWLTNGGGVAVGPNATVVTKPTDGIPGVIDSYLQISGELGGNRARVASLKIPDAPERKVYYFEYDVKYEAMTNGFADIALWPNGTYNSTTSVGNTLPIFRLTRNSSNELYWSTNVPRGANAGTKIDAFSGADSAKKWIRVQVTLDYETSQGKLKLVSLDSSEEEIVYTETFSLEGVSEDIGVFGIHATRSSGGANTSFSIANANFFTIDEIPDSITTTITENTLKKTDNTITGNLSVTITSYIELPAAVILAVYDNEGKLCFVQQKDITLNTGDNPVEFKEVMASAATAGKYTCKVFVWDSTNGMSPLGAGNTQATITG